MTLEVEAARTLVSDRPDDPSAHFTLAQTQDAAGDAEAALESLKIAIALAPQYAEAHNLMGILYASLGDFDKAGGSFQQALMAKPDYARAWNNLGNALKSAGRLAEALRPGGFLVVGSTERVANPAACSLESCLPFTYRKAA